MKEEVLVESAPAPSRVRRASWGAIFAGTFVTIVLQSMLTLLGVSLGLATLRPFQDQNTTQNLALGSAIWLLVSGLISLWIGACIAGRLSGGPLRADGMLHGIVTWSVATVAMLFLVATTAGALFGGFGSLLASAGADAQTGQSGGVAALQESLNHMFHQGKEARPPTGRAPNQT